MSNSEESAALIVSYMQKVDLTPPVESGVSGKFSNPQQSRKDRGRRMGVAAYNRGSVAVSRFIEQSYLDNGGQAKLNRETLERSEVLIERLEGYCLEVQAFFVMIQDSNAAKGIVAASIHEIYVRKAKTKKLERLLHECTLAHCDWVDSDRRFSVNHLQTCFRKARAWKAVFEYLNPKPAYVLPFNTPSM